MDEAERWLVMFRNNIDDMRSGRLSCDQRAERHWSGLREDAIEKLNKVPLMRRIFPPNFGYI